MQTNARPLPALCSPGVVVRRGSRTHFVVKSRKAAKRKPPWMCISRERERERGHLVLLIVTEPWRWTEELVWAAFYLNRLPVYPTTSHLPPPQYLMKYVQGKQRWGWCADLPPLWLTTTRPVPLLIYKACRVSARVASLTSLPRHKGTFKHPVYISGGARGAITKKNGSPISHGVKEYGGTAAAVNGPGKYLECVLEPASYHPKLLGADELNAAARVT